VFIKKNNKQLKPNSNRLCQVRALARVDACIVDVPMGMSTADDGRFILCLGVDELSVFDASRMVARMNSSASQMRLAETGGGSGSESDSGGA
jgi:hypothetical protein